MSDKFTFGSAGLLHELEMGMDRAGDWDPTLVKLLTSEDHLVHVREYLRGRAKIVPIHIEKPVTMPMVVNPDTFRVDYAIKATYPEWVKKRIGEFDRTDTVEYRFDQVKLWLHPTQENGGVIGGKALYQYIGESDILPTCFALRDLEEIQKLGIEVFRQHFRGKAIFAWKDVVQNRVGYLYVPCLVESDGKVVMRWGWRDDGWNDGYPALRVAS
jgi:hypothetical protein